MQLSEDWIYSIRSQVKSLFQEQYILKYRKKNENIVKNYKHGLKIKLLIDDKKARKIGRMEKVRIVGTLGILISAKDKGYVECIRPLIQKLESEKIFMSKVLVEKSLFLAEES